MSTKGAVFADPRVNALAHSVMNDDRPAVASAIAAGVPLNDVGARGILLLHLALVPKQPVMLQMLLAAGADPTARPPDVEGLSAAAAQREDKTSDHLRVLLDAGVDANALTGLRNRPLLMYAVAGENLATATLLLDRGADPNWHEPFGGTALHWAMLLPDFPMARLLLERGADPRISTLHQPPVPEAWCETALLRGMLENPESIAEFDALDSLMYRLHQVRFPCGYTGTPRK